MQAQNRGVLIVFEGIDGAGKTTLARFLHDHLNTLGYKVLLTREPGGSVVGAELRSIVHQQVTPLDPKTEFLLFAADRAQHVADIIKPGLSRSEIVISDRMADSSCAYQGYGRGLAIEMIEEVNKWVMNGVRPNLTLFIRVSLKTSRERVGKRGTLSSFEQQESFMSRVAQGFESMYADRSDVVTIDGDRSTQEVSKSVIAEVMKWLEIQPSF